MIFVVTILWFVFFGLIEQQAEGITVSPDLGKRNGTERKSVPYNISNNVNISIADRNRRLVPYMTFYVPDELPVSQFYALSMPSEQIHETNSNQYQPQQKQLIAIYSSQPQHQQQVRVQQQQQYVPNQRPSYFVQPKYQIQRPQQQYQAVLYGTRHQIPNKSHPSNNQDMVIPISYKQSNIFKSPQIKNTPLRLNPSPFRPENKVPGPFIPIVFPGQDIYNEKPKQSLQVENSDISPGYFIQQSVVNENTRQQSQNSLANEVSTPRTIYPLLNEINVNQPQSSHSHVPSHEDHRLLTQDEKYVIYLEEQLVNKQRQHQQKHQKQHQKFPSQIYQNQHSQIVLVSSTPIPLPDNQISHQDEPVKVSYKNLPPVYQEEFGHRQVQQQSQQENQQNYIEYVEPELHQEVVEVPVNHRVTTQAPIVVSSAIPIYVNQQMQRLKPVAQSHLAHQYFKQEKRPVYIQKPSQPVRQHLTETTHVPSPTLTTYHPTYATLKPTYASYHTSEKPLKLKPSQRYKPIVVTKPVPTLVQTKYVQPNVIQKESSLPDFRSTSLADILTKLQQSNHLPQTLTPDNIDNSIRTLIKILNNLKQSQTVVDNPPQHHDEDYEYDDSPPHAGPEPGPNSGRPGIDYPALAEIPHTSFNCKEQRYKGFFGDPETHCQVWHYCDLNGGQASFLCPNGTIFSQVALTCDWWFNVKCSSTAQLYVLNERLYKYILPFTPKFPEDYSGPLVDKYLALKFKEMEEKMRREKTKGKETSSEENENDENDENEKENDNSKNSTENSIKDDSKSEESHENGDDDDVDDEQNRGSIDTGIPIASSTTSTETPIIQLKPIVVTSTGSPFSSQSASSLPLSSALSPGDISNTTPKVKMRTSVESEKVEVIEIKTDGATGHLIPEHGYSEQK